MSYPEARGIVVWRSLPWFFDEDCWSWRPFLWRRGRGWSLAEEERAPLPAVTLAVTTLAGQHFHVQVLPDTPLRILANEVAGLMGLLWIVPRLFLGDEELKEQRADSTLQAALQEVLLRRRPFDAALFDWTRFGQDKEHLITAVATSRPRYGVMPRYGMDYDGDHPFFSALLQDS